MVELISVKGSKGHTIVKIAKFKVHIETTINVKRTIKAVNYKQALESLERRGTLMESLKALPNKDIQSISEKIYIVKVDE